MVMTYPIRRMKTCAVCGQEVRVTEIASYSTMGYTLDGRPLTLGEDIIPMMIQLSGMRILRNGYRQATQGPVDSQGSQIRARGIRQVTRHAL